VQKLDSFHSLGEFLDALTKEAADSLEIKKEREGKSASSHKVISGKGGILNHAPT